jgi:hypothetical protein
LKQPLRSFAAFPALFLLASLSLKAAFTFTSIDVAGAYSTYATAVNSSGDVAGYWENGQASSPGTTSQGFLLKAGTTVPVVISVSGASSTKLWAIDDSGIVYGSYVRSGGLYLFSYTYRSGSGLNITPDSTAIISIPAGGTNPTISGMNTAQVAVGSYSTASGLVGFQCKAGQAPRSIVYPNQANSQVTPRGINQSGQIALSIQYSLNTGQFLYDTRGFTSLDNAVFSVTGVGPQGQVLGLGFDNSGLEHGVVYQNGILTNVIYPGALADSTYSAHTIPVNMSNNGRVSGYYYDSSARVHGFSATSVSGIGDAMSLFVDFPPPQGTVSSRFTFSGWATSSSSPVAGVAIQVDGSLLGNAIYGLARPDACAAVPAQGAGCPNVGWSYSLDTALLNDGAHTLQVVATTANGTHTARSVPFNVANLTSPVDSLRTSIEVPSASNNSVRGTTMFSGYAYDVNSQMDKVQLYFDINISLLAGAFSGAPAVIGASRPDVCTNSGNAPNCLASAWSYSLNTVPLSNGVHTVTVIATAKNGDRKTSTASFSVNNPDPSITAVVNTPAANAQVSGLATASGWALDTRLPISKVELLVDGSPSPSTPAQAYFGGYRPDVCTSVTSIDCPNVGWSLPIDTTQLANGQHTLQAVVQSRFDGSSGLYDSVTTAPVPFLVNNGIPGTITQLNVDYPSPFVQQTFSSVANLSGWAIDNLQPVTDIFFSVDGIPVGATSPAISRPDVCAAYPNRPGCPGVGWLYSLDTNAFSNGSHILSVTARTDLDSQSTVSVPFNVKNNNGPLSTVLTIESPNSNTPALTGGVVTFGGWAVNEDTAIGKIAAEIDGAPYLPATTGLTRPDICLTMPQAVGCPYIGWSLPVDLSLFPNGVHRLTLTASVNNTFYSFSQNASASAYFTVNNNAGTSPFLTYIEFPNPNVRSVSGLANFSGWAIHKTSQISAVSVMIDGTPFGPASYTGVRPDVCGAYPSYVCPTGKTAGWNFSLDTTLLANGTHMLSVTATAASDGSHWTVASSFVVAN